MGWTAKIKAVTTVIKLASPHSPKLSTFAIYLAVSSSGQRSTAPFWWEWVKHATFSLITKLVTMIQRQPQGKTLFQKVKYLHKNTHLKKWILKTANSSYCWGNVNFFSCSAKSQTVPFLTEVNASWIQIMGSFCTGFGKWMASKWNRSAHKLSAWLMQIDEKFNYLQLHLILWLAGCSAGWLPGPALTDALHFQKYRWLHYLWGPIL